MGNLPCGTFRQCWCLVSFLASGFDLRNNDTWSLAMDSETRQSYPWTGEWIGIDAIIEYLSFYGSIFSSDVDSIADPVFDLSLSSDDECVALFTGANRVRTKKPYSTTEACIDFTAANVLRFTLSRDWFSFRLFPQPYIRRYDILTSEGFVNDLFGALDTDDMANYVCQDVLINACEEPGLVLADCLAEFNSLSVTDNMFWIDGNTKYCRMLHAAYAAENTIHCPHVNFKEQADVNGLVKCFDTKLWSPEAIFSEEEIATFESTLTLPYEAADPYLATYADGNCPDVEYSPSFISNKALPAVIAMLRFINFR